MKKVILAVLALANIMLFQQEVNAQLEAGIAVGLSTYQGDLAPNSISGSFSQLHFSGGLLARYNINNFFAVKLAGNYGKLSADDANSSTDGQKQRNLSFRSNIFEGGLTAEFNILGYQPYNYTRIFSPYIFVGVGFFNFKPETFYDNEWVELQPLGTEGQGIGNNDENYQLWEVNIPIGLGIKYALSDKWNVGLEIGLRKTFTDYIDDVSRLYGDNDLIASENGELAAILNDRRGEVSAEPVVSTPDAQRGNAEKNDSYIIGNIFISYNFADNGLVGGRRKARKKTGCPTF